MNFLGLATVFFINIHFANLYGGKREHTLLIKKKDKEKGAFIFPSLAYFIVIHHQILATKRAVPIVFLALCQYLSNRHFHASALFPTLDFPRRFSSLAN